jgi:hypothetical protein
MRWFLQLLVLVLLLALVVALLIAILAMTSDRMSVLATSSRQGE